MSHLDLSGCHIETIETGALQVRYLYLEKEPLNTLVCSSLPPKGMDSLRQLKLQDNRLNYLHGESLFPQELDHVEARKKGLFCVQSRFWVPKGIDSFFLLLRILKEP